MAWKLISEAPTDGTGVDLWVLHTPSGKGFRIPDCYWELGKWKTKGIPLYFGEEPTHFMYIPEPPQSEKD